MTDPERSEYIKGKNEGFDDGYQTGERMGLINGVQSGIEKGYSMAWKDIRKFMFGCLVGIGILWAYFWLFK